MSGSPKQQSLKKDRIFSDVNLKSQGSPPPDCLYDVGWYAIFSQRCSTSGSHRLASNVGLEEELHTANEK